MSDVDINKLSELDADKLKHVPTNEVKMILLKRNL